jgi:hypothetical protein
MTFQFVCRFTAVVGMILFVFLAIAPGAYTATYGVAADVGGIFLGRRASPLFLGLAMVAWLLSDQKDADVQRAVCLSMTFTFVGVAITGLLAFMAGTTSALILGAGVGELLIAAAFWYVRPKTYRAAPCGRRGRSGVW